MTCEQLVKLAGSWNRDGTSDTSVKEVTVPRLKLRLPGQ